MLTHADSQARIDETPATSLTEALAIVAVGNPDGIALTDAHRTLTHRETDRLTSALATILDDRLVPDPHTGAGVGPVTGDTPLGADTVPIGLMATHSVDGLLAMLGLVKAGRLFVALDPHLPEARLMHVIRLAGITEILADAENVAASQPLVAPDPAAPNAGRGTVHRLEQLLDEARAIAETDDDIPVVPAGRARGGRDGLTIIFTSGSTGAPKGVVMTHRQALVDAASQRLTFRFDAQDRVASVLPHGFAAGFMLPVTSLLSGASVHIVDPRDTGIEKLVAWVDAQHLTTLHCTPHLLRSVTAALDPSDDRLRGLRMFATVGEAITGPDIAALRPLMGPTASFWNWTGSSETNVIAFNEIGPGDPIPDGPVPSGRIAFGKEVRILRPDGTQADVGETGDIVVVSDAMTSGYWGNPEQTATRAGVDADGTPTWKQGDLGRFDAEGRITLLGRADDAVKVRGYLVEPSEVESALRRLDGVQEAVVIAVKNPPAPTRLIAYVVSAAGRRTASPAAIRRALRDQLPDYMVPGAIVPMIALPRNERGKVDRAQLPDAPMPGSTLPTPAAPATATSSETAAAQVVVGAAEPTGSEMNEHTFDQWELVVGQIWAEVLGLHAVGLDDDFAELGGDSLSAEEMLAAVQERIGVDLRSSEVLEHPTVRDFARRVRAGAAAIPSHPDVVKLTSGGSGAPIFCISGAGALSLTFLPLSRHLAGHDVYAFQQHGLERRTMPDWSVPAAARRYLELMRVVQPRGPYLLIGHSLGGLVALEIARMLTEAGEQVEHVVLLDTYLPRTTAQQGAMEFARLPQQDATTPAARLRRGLDRQFRRVLPGGAAQFRRVGRRLRAYGAGVVQFDGQKQFDAFFDQAVLMSKRFRVPQYDGRVTFVQADGNPDGREAWTPYLVGDMRWPRLASEHSSLLREPHVTELAAVLRAAIDGETPDGTAH
ncbi:alpha/beta fold hydrolase [Curtobacterium sp. RRHDQ10]|uniref:alpha/beta fold hydrolase n=1 Tax=Curtobacterium phyllosphaerae TaxID=3413379 RepID=UPI003BF38DEB